MVTPINQVTDHLCHCNQSVRFNLKKKKETKAPAPFIPRNPPPSSHSLCDSLLPLPVTPQPPHAVNRHCRTVRYAPSLSLLCFLFLLPLSDLPLLLLSLSLSLKMVKTLEFTGIGGAAGSQKSTSPAAHWKYFRYLVFCRKLLEHWGWNI